MLCDSAAKESLHELVISVASNKGKTMPSPINVMSIHISVCNLDLMLGNTFFEDTKSGNKSRMHCIYIQI